MTGGYVGVSVFFTLSGYLITSLALAEHDRTGRLDVRAFYGRRIRRLLPASLALPDRGRRARRRPACSTTSSTSAATCGPRSPRSYNWVALGGGQSYAELVGDGAGRRPARPLLVAGHRGAVLLGVAAGPRRGPAPWHRPPGRAWSRRSTARRGDRRPGDRRGVGTGRRLLGDAGPARRDPRRRPRRRRAPPPALARLPATAVVARRRRADGDRRRRRRRGRQRSGPAYAGWLPVFALASAAVMLGLQVPSPLRRALAWRPLVALGAISYGVYLFHWPIYAVLDERAHRPRPSAPLFALRVGGHAGRRRRVVPSPSSVRCGGHRRSPGDRRPAVAVAACVVVALVGDAWPPMRRPLLDGPVPRPTATPPPSSPSPASPRCASPRDHDDAASDHGAGPRRDRVDDDGLDAGDHEHARRRRPRRSRPPRRSRAGLSRPVRILVIGDSTAWATGDGHGRRGPPSTPTSPRSASSPSPAAA